MTKVDQPNVYLSDKLRKVTQMPAEQYNLLCNNFQITLKGLRKIHDEIRSRDNKKININYFFKNFVNQQNFSPQYP